MIVNKNNTNYNISMKRLYFPASINKSINKEIKEAIIENPYIKLLSKNEDVIVSFSPKSKDGLMQHILILDVIDFKVKEIKKSMWYSSRLFGMFKDISPVEFINKISEPIKAKPVKGFWGKFFKKKNNPNQTPYFNYEEVSPNKYNAEEKALNINEQLKQAELKRRNLIIDSIKA